jgi:colicin import membrane protein
MPKTTTPSADLAALDAKLAELKASSRTLAAERGGAKRRHENARAQVVTLQSHQLAGENVTAELATAEKAEAEARAEALAEADRDWAGEAQAIDGAIRRVTSQRAQALATNAAPLIEELVPEANAAATRIIDAAADLSAALGAHESVMSQAEQVLHHLDFYDRRKDIPADGDEFVALRRALDILKREGVPWPLPDLTTPPHKLQFLGAEDQAAWTPPAKAAA